MLTQHHNKKLESAIKKVKKAHENMQKHLDHLEKTAATKKEVKKAEKKSEKYSKEHDKKTIKKHTREYHKGQHQKSEHHKK